MTRPEPDAAPIATALRARGIEPVSAPLLRIEPEPAGAARLSGALIGVQAVLFTSANGARAFARASNRFELPAFCVGEATAAAARIAGFRTVASADGDGADLAALAGSRLAPGNGALLHAAGADSAGDLAAELAAKGFSVRRVVLYRAIAADALPPGAEAAWRRGEFALALFFSPRTAASFVSVARAAGLAKPCERMTALALSRNVAAALSELPWRAIVTASAPNLAAMLTALDEIGSPSA
ncbi:MAG TPA: uroporphyrinogen-III synthase [Stellaceae bacterium]|nr:uroporphyrinogen-III synthase [Stellaceae bacterium]